MAKKKKKVDEQLMLDGVIPPGPSFEAKKTKEEIIEADPNQITFDEFIEDSILEKETVNELMKEAVASEQKHTKKKSSITNLIFLAINIIFMVFIVKNLLDSAGGSSPVEVFKEQGDKMWWLLVGIGLLILFFVCETFLFYTLIKSTTGKRKFFLSYRLASIGKYYDFITPTQIGGQPSQIIRLTKSGIGAGLATSIPIIKLIVYNFVYTIICVISFFVIIPLIPIKVGFQTFLMTLIKINSCFLLFILYYR